MISIDYFSNNFAFTSTAPPSIFFVGGGSALPPPDGPSFFDLSDGIYEFKANADGTWNAYQDFGAGYVSIDSGTAGSFTATPEPSSFLLIGGGVAALAALRRRKA